MKNYAIPICLFLFFFLVLISCKQGASKQEPSYKEDSILATSNLGPKPADRGKIDETKPGGDTIIVKIHPWDKSTNTPISGGTIYYSEVRSCDIPCSFKKGNNEQGDYVKFKLKGNSDTVEIQNYEYLAANDQDHRPADRGKIDETRPFKKVEGSDTIIVRICLWDMEANTLKPVDSIYYAKVPECDIPCSFTPSCDEEGDFVKFKRKKKYLDSVEVEIRSYEYKEKE